MASKSEIAKTYRKSIHGLLVVTYSAQLQRIREKRLPPIGYTFDELEAKYGTDKKFIRLYNEWVESGFKKGKRPSFDRISRKKTYSLDNITCMTWEENRHKQRMEAKLCKTKKVCAVSNTTVVATYFSVSEAARKLKISQANISRALKNKNRTCGGYRWFYLDQPHYLIKQGFDLFGLIDAGLAIDAKTINKTDQP